MLMSILEILLIDPAGTSHKTTASINYAIGSLSGATSQDLTYLEYGYTRRVKIRYGGA